MKREHYVHLFASLRKKLARAGWRGQTPCDLKEHSLSMCDKLWTLSTSFSSTVGLLLSMYSYNYLRWRRKLCFYFCLFVCPSDNWKSCERILTKFLGGVRHGPGTKWLNFGDDPDHRPDPGVRSPKSGFTGLSKKYLVDSDQSCMANLHCTNLSAILLSWRSAEICALWVLLVICTINDKLRLCLILKMFLLHVIALHWVAVGCSDCGSFSGMDNLQ